MLTQYELQEYKDVVEACLRGDMVALETAISTNMDQYIKSGVFTVLERMRMVCLKNFIKKVTIAVNATPELQLH